MLAPTTGRAIGGVTRRRRPRHRSAAGPRRAALRRLRRRPPWRVSPGAKTSRRPRAIRICATPCSAARTGPAADARASARFGRRLHGRARRRAGPLVHLVFDHGPLGHAPLAAHGHADALAVWLAIAASRCSSRRHVPVFLRPRPAHAPARKPGPQYAERRRGLPEPRRAGVRIGEPGGRRALRDFNLAPHGPARARTTATGPASASPMCAACAGRRPATPSRMRWRARAPCFRSRSISCAGPASTSPRTVRASSSVRRPGALPGSAAGGVRGPARAGRLGRPQPDRPLCSRSFGDLEPTSRITLAGSLSAEAVETGIEVMPCGAGEWSEP